MRKEVMETGKTVEEAINTACETLGCDRELVEWEIVDLPKKGGFLGLKNIPAKVKVWLEVPDTQAPPSPAQPQPRQAAPAPRQEPAREKAQQKPAESKPQQAERPAAPPREERVIEMTGEVKQKTDVAIAYLQEVCAQMDLAPTFKAVPRDGGVCINAEGDGLGAIIGRRGETLDALQYLAGLVANRLEGEYLRLTLDCGDYRVKRKSTLEALAKKLSSQVLKTNVSKTLEPMNPFERRIIHATVSEIEGVSSTSVGEEPNRRVIITSPTARSPRAGGGRGGQRQGGGRGGDRPTGGGDRGNRRPRQGQGGGPRRSGPPRERPERPSQGGSINTLPQSYPSAPKEPLRQTPEEASRVSNDKPLYTKLDLE